MMIVQMNISEIFLAFIVSDRKNPNGINKKILVGNFVREYFNNDIQSDLLYGFAQGYSDLMNAFALFR